MYPNNAFVPMVQVVQTQRALGDAFAEMSQKSPELQEEFAYNCETQRVISKNGETLIGKWGSLGYNDILLQDNDIL